MLKRCALLLLVGCSAGSDDSTTPDAGMNRTDASAPADAAPPGVVSPGTWSYVTYTKTADTCGSRVEGNDAIPIDMVTATSFRIKWPGSTPLYSPCIVNASNYYACTKATATADQAPVYDAIVMLSAELSGRITTTTLATGMQRLTVGCTGTQCAEVNATPCSVSANIVIEKAGT